MAKIKKIKINEVEYDIHAKMAESSTKATQDASGNTITTTYETKSDATAKLAEAKTYADNAATAVKNDLLNGAGGAYDTLKELGDLIEENVDAIDALETVAASKADKVHTHSVDDITGVLPIANGGTGADNVEDALVNLGAAPAEHTHSYMSLKQAEINLHEVPSKVLSRNSPVQFIRCADKTILLIGNDIYYSSDEINWEQASLGICDDYPLELKDVIYGKGVFVGRNYNNGILFYSTDGINWAESFRADSVFSNVVYGNGKFVAADAWSNIVVYSADGINWTQVFMDEENYIAVTCAAYGDGKFVMMPDAYDSVWYSTDGINWNKATLPIEATWTEVVYGNGKFVAIEPYGNIVWSTDGINWSHTMLQTGSIYSGLTYGNGKFVCGKDAGEIIYSTDGINWNQVTLLGVNDGCSVYSVYGNNKFVVVPYSTDEKEVKIACSEDCVNWTYATLHLDFDEFSFMSGDMYVFAGYCNEKFIIVRTCSNDIYYSTDGINWTNTYQYIEQDGIDIASDVKDVIMALLTNVSEVGA